jgi:hypothetical protein
VKPIWRHQELFILWRGFSAGSAQVHYEPREGQYATALRLLTGVGDDVRGTRAIRSKRGGLGNGVSSYGGIRTDWRHAQPPEPQEPLGGLVKQGLIEESSFSYRPRR